jgi:hypothetical protein
MNYYQRYRRSILKGSRLSPRGKQTWVNYNASFDFKPGTTWRRPYDNPAIGFIEGLQFIGGIAEPLAISAAAPKVNLGLFGPTSFYGPRTVNQFEQAINELKNDPASRRAVVLIAHHDDTPDTIPCTQQMQFYIKQDSNELDCTITMRSSDAVWGLPYDMIQFGMVIQAMASCLGLLPGTAKVNMTNAHIYADHDGGINWREEVFFMPKLHSWSEYKEWAREIVKGCPTRTALESMFMLHNIEGD